MKITLVEFDEFQKSLSDDWYFVDDELYVNEEFWDGNYDPSSIIDVKKDDITIAWQGPDPSPKNDTLDFLTEYKKWKNNCYVDILVVEIPKDKKDDLVKIIKELGGSCK